MGIDSDCDDRDDPILKFGPRDGSKLGPRVIFGHGVGGLDLYANTFIVEMVERWSRDPRLAHVTFLLPTAPTRPVEMLGNKEVPAWFGCAQDASIPSGWRVNYDHLNEAAETYGNLALSWGGTRCQTVYAGFSNGGATALYAGLTGCGREYAGILVMSSLLVAQDEVLECDNRDTTLPVLLCYGDEDPYLADRDVASTLSFLAKHTACEVETRAFKGMGHTCCEEEIAACADWLARVFPVDDAAAASSAA